MLLCTVRMLKALKTGILRMLLCVVQMLKAPPLRILSSVVQTLKPRVLPFQTVMVLRVRALPAVVHTVKATMLKMSPFVFLTRKRKKEILHHLASVLRVSPFVFLAFEMFTLGVLPLEVKALAPLNCRDRLTLTTMCQWLDDGRACPRDSQNLLNSHVCRSFLKTVHL